jgi:alkylation response protein AidB-like acyl-CoA dehydrogenase
MTPEGTIAAITLPVDREGLSILDDWDGFGQRLTGTGTTRHDPQILQVVGEIAAQVAAAEAKVAIDAFAPRTASRLFDVGGASATQSSANLDRHWRNIRTISIHNPTINKASAVGDFFVNGTPPPRNGFF